MRLPGRRGPTASSTRAGRAPTLGVAACLLALAASAQLAPGLRASAASAAVADSAPAAAPAAFPPGFGPVADCLRARTTPEDSRAIARWVLGSVYATDARYRDLFAARSDAERDALAAEAARAYGRVLTVDCYDPLVKVASATRDPRVLAFANGFLVVLAVAPLGNAAPAGLQSAGPQLLGRLEPGQRTKLALLANTPAISDFVRPATSPEARAIVSTASDEPSLARIAPGTDVAALCPYPAESRAAGEQGQVELGFDVGVDGSASNFVVESSSGSARLDSATIECLGRARYVPPQRDGRAYASRQRIRWTWRLDP